MGATIGGGRSLVGTLQEVSNDSGFWSITLGGIWIRTNAQVKRWREIEGLLQGRLGTCNVPVFDSKRAPWPNGVPGATIVCTVSGSIAVGATTGVLNMTTGADPEPGMFFSVGERLYRINTVTYNSGDIFTVTFLPGARDAISNGASVEFGHPICRCRLVADDGMALPLDLQRFAMIDIPFEEDV
jgi:hypothetical protein